MCVCVVLLLLLLLLLLFLGGGHITARLILSEEFDEMLGEAGEEVIELGEFLYNFAIMMCVLLMIALHSDPFLVLRCRLSALPPSN